MPGKKPQRHDPPDGSRCSVTRTADEITQQWVLQISRRVPRAKDLLGAREQRKPPESAPTREPAATADEPEHNKGSQGLA